MIADVLHTEPLAHTGHVLIDLSVFMGPVLMVAIWLTIASWRDRHKDRNGS